jgi:phage-related protein
MAEAPNRKTLIWVASAKKDLKETPEDVQDQVGYALDQVQAGETPDCATPLHGALSGVFEIKANDEDGATYRATYTTKIGDVVYVLDVFKKKSKHGIATPQTDLDRIEKRLKAAREHYEQQKR